MQSAAVVRYERRSYGPMNIAGGTGVELRSRALPGVRIAVHSDLRGVERIWREFELRSVHTAFQRFDYLSAWFRNIGAREDWRPAIVVVHGTDGVLAILPLAVSNGRLFRRMSWLGQELCDYLAPLSTEEFARIPAGQFRAFWRELGALLQSHPRFRHDWIDLRRMPQQVDGNRNICAALPSIRHASDGHVAHLGTDWDRLYRERRSGKARKQDRSKLRRLEEFGDVELIAPREPAQIERILETLFTQKSESFARKGISDLFARPGYREFFRDLAIAPHTRDWVHVSALTAGPTLAATSLSMEHGRHSSLLLIGYDHSFAQLSPGVIQMNRLIERAIGRGTTEFDFLVGEQRLKQEWADVSIPLYDHIAAASYRGHLIAHAVRLISRFKRAIKQSPALWKTLQALRSVRGVFSR